MVTESDKKQWDDGNTISGEWCSLIRRILERCYYIGQRKENRYNSEGTLYYKNGDRYEAGWKDGDYCGYGILYKDNGDKHRSIWDYNYDGQGEINYKDRKKYKTILHNIEIESLD